MKKFLKDNLYILLTLFFVFLLFQKNIAFKKCILEGSIVFFENVFPSLFPMFIVNDILMNYNFFYLLDKSVNKILKKIFGFSTMASYIFVMSMFSGTPTNAYITANLIHEKKLSSKDASIVLTYSCFLNPLFLYNMLNTIFNNTAIVVKLMLINYGLNFLIAFWHRKYPYEQNTFSKTQPNSFSITLAKSLKRSTDTLFLILGTIIFYFILCEGITTFINFPLLNCFTNGLLEATGGLSKLSLLNINIHLKEILASIFISFGGLSIHTQIKNIITESQIPYKNFLLSRIIHTLLSTIIIIST